MYLTWPGGHVWATPHQKNCRPAHLCLAVTAYMRILTLLRSSHDIVPSMAPMLMRTRPDPNHASSSLPPCPGKPPHRQRHAMTSHDHPGCAPSSGRAPAPLTCPAPSQRIAAIPHASHTPFVCPSAMSRYGFLREIRVRIRRKVVEGVSKSQISNSEHES